MPHAWMSCFDSWQLDFVAPAVCVRKLTELDAGDLLIEFLADMAYDSVIEKSVRGRHLGFFQDWLYVYMRHWRDDDCCSAGCCLFEFRKFADRNLTFLDFHSEVFGYLLQGFVGD